MDENLQPQPFLKRELMKATFWYCFHYNPTIYKGKKSILQNVYDAYGKHILEAYMNQYVSKQEFAEMMEELGIYPNAKGLYPYRINPDKYVNWA
jgi:hypothetical protein